MHKRILSLIIQEVFFFFSLLIISWQVVLELHILKNYISVVRY